MHRALSATAIVLAANALPAQPVSDCPGPGCPGLPSLETLFEHHRGVVREEVVSSLPVADQVVVNLQFGFNSTEVAATQQPELRLVCNALLGSRISILRIVGHTDAAGSAAYNQRLSARRAESVKRFFVEDCGVRPDRLEAVGVGESLPLAGTDPYSPENRRVEFQAIW